MPDLPRLALVADPYLDTRTMHLVKPIDPIELIVAISTLAPRRIGAS